MTSLSVNPRRRQKSIRVPLGLGADPHILFLALLKREGIAAPLAEFRFDPDRRWRFDYAWRVGVALEVEGGVFARGRHVRPTGFLKDCEKYNEAALQGWTVIRVTPQQLPTPETIALLHRAFQLKTGTP